MNKKSSEKSNTRRKYKKSKNNTFINPYARKTKKNQKWGFY
jgi:hypothetical protein